MADLVGGKFGQSNPVWNLLGQPANATTPNIPARSIVEVTGLSGLADTAAALVSGGVTVVAVPVDVGTTISKVSALVGATAAGTPTQSFAAVYSAVAGQAPALLAQSVSGGTAAIAASGRFDFTLASPVTITAANAPLGFVWVAVSVTATAVPSLATVPTGAAAAQYQWFSGSFGGAGSGMASLAATFGAAVGATAPATITGATKAATAPVLFVS